MNPEQLHIELNFSTARSGGSGGQHVNKVETKVFLYFDINNSNILTPEQKERIFESLSSYISKDGVLTLSHDRKRSQLANKKEVINKFNALVIKALRKRKKRIRTKPSLASIKANRKAKEKRSETKTQRQKPKIED